MAPLKFVPWASSIDTAFYGALASIKVDHDKLDDSARKVLGVYEIRPNDSFETSARMQIHGNALTTDGVSAGFYRAEGSIKNYNTAEDFSRAQKEDGALQRAGKMIWDAICDGTIYSCPSLLCSFYARFYADLKRYRFTYHFCFPALHSDPNWETTGDSEPGRLGSKETSALVEAVGTWRYGVDSRQHGFFLAKRVKEVGEASSLADGDLGFVWMIGSLSSFEGSESHGGFFDNTPTEDRFVCFVDPSDHPSGPGWMLRNYLVLVRRLWKLDEVQVLCYRDTMLKRDQPWSLVLNLKSASPMDHSDTPSMPKVTGWERDRDNLLRPQMKDLGSLMDPVQLADQSVDLNLKLIKWRIAPTLDLDVVKNTSCLLLGAGTLGSYVSRNLLGWGVRKITFVDYAKVSYSNPVRQPLFSFEDCKDGGKQKALRGAEALKEIYPNVEASGEILGVPMVGHAIVEDTRKDFERLQKLVDEHDVLFLLLDSRESRWLPTVMGKAAGKIVLNAALGFESYVVMRQGLKATKEGEEELGCYFCNDVFAPGNTQKDATLDQQCTVTRPGVAPTASALLVELMVSILQHPLGARAPSTTTSPIADPISTTTTTTTTTTTEFKHPLGALPHQIRGFLSSFSSLTITGRPYPHCSACCDKVVDAYRADGWEFVRRALADRKWLEDLTGLTEVHELAQRMAEEMEELDDEEDEGEMV